MGQPRCEPAARRDSGKRPTFPRPDRQARTRALRVTLDEFCTLSFNDVDAANQKALTQRMLVQLKSLADPVKYWEDGELRTEDGAYMLVGLEEADMYALGHKIKRAGKLIDENLYHAAYDKLC